MLRFDRPIGAKAGQYVFAWLPDDKELGPERKRSEGTGYKPFSVMDDDPLTLGVLERGCLSKKLGQLSPGSTVYIQGPHGRSVDVDGDLALVGGGCGIAGVYLFAKQHSAELFIGGKDKDHLPVDMLDKVGKVRYATDDGSLGHHGNVTDLLSRAKPGSTFINCGPPAMVDAAVQIEQGLTSPDKIYSSKDRTTKCGRGLCGSCANEKGELTCLEGPFMRV